VKIAIIGYSKGTISSRLYLKSLHTHVNGLPGPRGGFNPISEFIAISPPNHGISSSRPEWFALLATSLALRQLSNGYNDNCNPILLVPEAASIDFIQELNGHSILHSQGPTLGAFPDEAPGSRSNGSPPSAGTLYVTLYDEQGRDSVGGGQPSSDCQGRILAKNLAPDAVNLGVPGISDAGNFDDGDSRNVHANTVHTPEVICRALYTVAHHQAPPAGLVCEEVNDVPLIPPRAAIVLVLDMSGSMLFPACPTCDPKLDVLKRAVELFVALWSSLGDGGDRVGVTYFRTQVSPPGGPQLVELTNTTATSVIDEVEGQGTVLTNLTAMGGGLQVAIDALRPPGAPPVIRHIPQRHIILFTDGIQNVNPMVERHDNVPSAGDFQLQIENAPNVPASNVTPTSPPTVLDTALGISVHAVGVGAAPNFLARLADIAGKTGGNLWTTVDPDNDLIQVFTQALIESLRGNSPQLVDYRRAALQERVRTESFEVNGGGRRIVLKLSWKGDQRLDFQVYKDGVDLTHPDRFKVDSFYRIFSIGLPVEVNGQVIDSQGEWQMRISGPPGVPYEAAAIVDEPSLRSELTFERLDHEVGEPIKLGVTLSVDGRPVPDVSQVTATVFAPEESVGSILSVHATPAEPADFATVGGTAAQRKLQLLLRSGEVQQRLRPVARKVTLRSNGDGTYSGVYRETTVPGPYRVVVEIGGDHARIGRFRRMETGTALVRFGEADTTASDVRTTVLEQLADARHIELSLRPRDRHDNYLGPGFAAQIKVAVLPDWEPPLEDHPEDHGDGGYSFPLRVPLDEDPQVTLTVMNHELFSGLLSDIERRADGPRWWISLVVLLALVAVIAVWKIARPARAPS
jgi:hypothetical protein